MFILSNVHGAATPQTVSLILLDLKKTKKNGLSDKYKKYRDITVFLRFRKVIYQLLDICVLWVQFFYTHLYC